MLSIFSYACGPFVYLWRYIQVLCPFSDGVVFFVVELNSLYILNINPFQVQIRISDGYLDINALFSSYKYNNNLWIGQMDSQVGSQVQICGVISDLPVSVCVCVCVCVRARAQSHLTLQPHGWQPARFLCPWDFPRKNIGVDCHFILQGIFPTQGQNLGLLCLLHSLPLHDLESPTYIHISVYKRYW